MKANKNADLRPQFITTTVGFFQDVSLQTVHPITTNKGIMNWSKTEVDSVSCSSTVTIYQCCKAADQYHRLLFALCLPKGLDTNRGKLGAAPRLHLIVFPVKKILLARYLLCFSPTPYLLKLQCCKVVFCVWMAEKETRSGSVRCQIPSAPSSLWKALSILKAHRQIILALITTSMRK